MAFLGVLAILTPITSVNASNVRLAWDDASSDPAVAGYRVYYGAASRTYTNVVDVGMATTVTISNLLVGTTYSFAATTYSIAGLESDYSSEINYMVPAPPLNSPPTIDSISDLSIPQDAGPQTVNLTGIGSGSPTENQTLVVSAFSSNPSLIPSPVVTYASPQSTGKLAFTPATGSFGGTVLTVMVDDGGSISNTTIKTFAVTVNQTNAAPTLDAIADIVITQNSGTRVVNLTGISDGSPTENQPLSVVAVSDNPGIIPNPVVAYTSPNTTGTLTLNPVTNALGTATITVAISDAQTVNNSFSQSFKVTVQAVTSQGFLTNTVVSPNEVFKMVLNPPITNGHKFSFTLDATAPEGAKVTVRRSVPSFVWTPSTAYASTTNLVRIRATDNTDSTITTNLLAQLIVHDFVSVIPLNASVEAGQTGSLPLTVACSDGITNLSFLLSWPTARFNNPSLSVTAPSVASGSVQVQGTNLLVRIGTLPGKVIEGSNLVAQLNFRAVNNQTSAFVGIPVVSATATKPTGAAYAEPAGLAGEIVVISGTPLLRSSLGSTGARTLQMYGKVGTSYQVQYNTSLLSGSAAGWSSLTTYSQTNIAQTMTVDSAPPIIFYRLQQQ